MSERDTGFETPFNVIAAFVQEHDGAVAVDSLAESGVPRSAITVHRPADGPTGEEVAELVAEMQDELVSSAGAFSRLRAMNWRRRQEGDADDKQLAAERDVLVAVHLTDRVGAERAATLLRELGAERVHLIALHGVPLPPQARHPRPADPEGYWWRNAGHG